jgi:hypothetical protein
MKAIILGEVQEKVSSAVKPLQPSSTTTSSSGGTGMTHAHLNNNSVKTNLDLSAKIKVKDQSHVLKNDVLVVGIELAKISQLLSSKNIEFLRNRQTPSAQIESSIAPFEDRHKDESVKLAWTSLEPSNKALLSNLQPTLPSLHTRFDLQGRVILPNTESMASKLTSLLMEYHPNISQHQSDSISELLLTFITSCLHIQFIVLTPYPENVATVPQHELFNHEFEQDSPGYTLTEALEVHIYST